MSLLFNVINHLSFGCVSVYWLILKQTSNLCRQDEKKVHFELWFVWKNIELILSLTQLGQCNNQTSVEHIVTYPARCICIKQCINLHRCVPVDDLYLHEQHARAEYM